MTAVLASPPPPAAPARITPEQMVSLPDDGKLYELIDGELVEKPMSDISQFVANRLKRVLDFWALPTDAGEALVEATFRCFRDAPDKVRRPDVAFVSHAKLARYAWGQGHFSIVPDLAVEVVSPNDEVIELDRKIHEYLAVGVRSVWIINPELRILRQHHRPGDVREFVGDVEVTDESVLPGFRCVLGALFVQPAATT